MTAHLVTIDKLRGALLHHINLLHAQIVAGCLSFFANRNHVISTVAPDIVKIHRIHHSLLLHLKS
mgnify:CR=1 FL=1